MSKLIVYTVVAHEAMTSNMKTFEIKTTDRVSYESALHSARIFTADKGLVFDTMFEVVSL